MQLFFNSLKSFLPIFLLFFFFRSDLAPAAAASGADGEESELVDDGHWGLQDFSHPVRIFGESIYEIHRDMYLTDRDLQKRAKDRGTTGKPINLVLGKISLFFEEEDRIEIPFHRMEGSPLPMVFDSKASRSLVTKAFGKQGEVDFAHLDYEELDFPVIEEEDTHHFPNTIAGNTLKEDKKATIIDIQRAREAHTIRALELKRQIDNLERAPSNQHFNDIKEEVDKEIDALKKSTKNKLSNLSIIVSKFWHSEPRTLFQLRKWCDDGLMRALGLSLRTPPKAVVLHLHSTQDSCNRCRLQIVGAVYHWLYAAMVDAFSRDDVVPYFHTVVSYRLPYDPYTEKGETKYSHTVDHPAITLDNISAYADIEEEIYEYTKPVVSFVKIDERDEII